MKVKELRPESKVDVIELTIRQKGEARDFSSRSGSTGKVADAKAVDDEGTEVSVSLWNEAMIASGRAPQADRSTPCRGRRERRNTGPVSRGDGRRGRTRGPNRGRLARTQRRACPRTAACRRAGCRAQSAQSRCTPPFRGRAASRSCA